MREISDLKYSSANLFMRWLILCLKVQRYFQVSDENRSSLVTIFPTICILHSVFCTGSSYAEVFGMHRAEQTAAVTGPIWMTPLLRWTIEAGFCCLF